MNTFKEIKIKYKWDRENFLKASEIVYNYELKNSPKRFLGWIFIALSQFGVVMAMKKGAIGLLAISTILILYWYSFRWKIRKYFINKTFDKLPNANQNFSIIAKKEGLYLNDKKINWSNILEIISLKEGVLLYIDKNFLFFPKESFKNFEEKKYFLEFVKVNLEVK